MNNGGGFYPSPYNSTPYNGVSSHFNIPTPPAAPPYFNVPFQSSQQTYQNSQQAVTNQQNHENISNIPSFKFYDLDSNNDHEIIRLLFSFGGVTYKYKRYKQDEWNKAKEKIPFENLPLLRVNNQFKIFQLNTIIRYLAREFHLYGIGQTDHAIVDMVYETSCQFREKIFDNTNNDSIDFQQKLRQVTIEHSAKYLKQLEKYYEIFNRPGPFYLGTHLSLADLIVYDTITYLIKIDKKILDNHPHLKDARRRLEKYPRLFNYMNTKNNNNHAKENKTQHQHSVPSRRDRTKSPVQNGTSNNNNVHHRHQHHHHHHRHQSHEEDEIHYHHRHHHHHHHNNNNNNGHQHRRTHSKEPTPLSQKKQRSVRQSESPSISTKDKVQASVSQKKQRSVQQSNSPSSSTKDKESTPSLQQTKQQSVRSSTSPTNLAEDKKQTAISQTKKRSVRSSKSPTSLNKDKEAAPLRTTDVIPPPPPVPTQSVPLPPPPPPVNNDPKPQSTNN